MAFDFSKFAAENREELARLNARFLEECEQICRRANRWTVAARRRDRELGSEVLANIELGNIAMASELIKQSRQVLTPSTRHYLARELLNATDPSKPLPAL